MIAILICGRAETAPFAGRNTFPLLGRPMMVYPALAGLHSKERPAVFLSTDSEQMARIGSFYGLRCIERPVALCDPSLPVEPIVSHGYQQIVEQLGEVPEILVLLLANAPTVTSELVDQSVATLRNDRSMDAVVTVTRRNVFAPRFATQLAEDGVLRPYAAAVQSDRDAYFPDALLWALRPASFFGPGVTLADGIVDASKQRVGALVHEGYGDVDHAWQIPAVAAWLTQSGFTETSTPYDRGSSSSESTLVELVREDWSDRIRKVPSERRVLVTTIPFGEADPAPLKDLAALGASVVVNPLGRKLAEADLAKLIPEFGILVAGTEPVTEDVMALAPHLRLISRVGIGLDSVDLAAARARGIQVSYTPDAPAPAVAELTVGLMLDLLRGISSADRQMRSGVWHRVMGRRLSEMTVGIIGVGRVGRKVATHLCGGFEGVRLLGNDLIEDSQFAQSVGMTWVVKEDIFREADIVTLHLPLTGLTRNLVTLREMSRMKKSVLILNTARGGIVSELDLKVALEQKRIAGAALDVFDHEPYSGPLTTVTNCLLTSHMGSMSKDCRGRMEREAVDEALRFLRGEPLQALVPEAEYAVQAVMRKPL